CARVPLPNYFDFW
nr:immunoglobulin heavy chain junction region [Mus musculus]